MEGAAVHLKRVPVWCVRTRACSRGHHTRPRMHACMHAATRMPLPAGPSPSALSPPAVHRQPQAIPTVSASCLNHPFGLRRRRPPPPPPPCTSRRPSPPLPACRLLPAACRLQMDKIVESSSRRVVSGGVSSEGVQRDLLPIIEVGGRAAGRRMRIHHHHHHHHPTTPPHNTTTTTQHHTAGRCPEARGRMASRHAPTGCAMWAPHPQPHIRAMWIASHDVPIP